MALKKKIISSLEKCMIDQNIDEIKSFENVSVLKGEKLYFQYVISEDDPAIGTRRIYNFKIENDIGIDISVRRVEHVPCRLPVYYGTEKAETNFISMKPGLYPDVLVPVKEREHISAVYSQTDSYWLEADIPENAAAGEYSINVSLVNNNTDDVVCTDTLKVRIINAVLPKQDVIVTQWFHCDSLATYYNTKAFDEQHWTIIENYIKTAVSNGINMILTPVLTPPLDTEIGKERMTVQLVDIYKDGDKYSFGFDKLERWVDMCLRNGVEYFEIAHFFTQWGAAHAPKVVAYVNGSYKEEKIFGWETDACGEEYVSFLRSFVPAIIEFFKKRGLDKKCYFHISDEPGMDHLEAYKNAKSAVEDILQDYHIIDALSDYDFYRTGAVKNPVPANNHIKPFIENNVPELWTYYCCGQYVKVSNRFIAMPSYRNRIIGTQFYKFNIVGFLQWGYNFYYSFHSLRPINPYLITDGDFWVPAGDAYSVYPACDGTAFESLRINVFQNALQDNAALKLCEKLIGREATLKLIEEGTEEPLAFDSYPDGPDYILSLREKINAAIEENIR